MVQDVLRLCMASRRAEAISESRFRVGAGRAGGRLPKCYRPQHADHVHAPLSARKVWPEVAWKAAGRSLAMPASASPLSALPLSLSSPLPFFHFPAAHLFSLPFHPQHSHTSPDTTSLRLSALTLEDGSTDLATTPCLQHTLPPALRLSSLRSRSPGRPPSATSRLAPTDAHSKRSPTPCRVVRSSLAELRHRHSNRPAV
nr:hypothetical protein CFP56_10996 [Quercus suber]